LTWARRGVTFGGSVFVGRSPALFPGSGIDGNNPGSRPKSLRDATERGRT
jgi:hypothetical protein